MILRGVPGMKGLLVLRSPHSTAILQKPAQDTKSWWQVSSTFNPKNGDRADAENSAAVLAH